MCRRINELRIDAAGGNCANRKGQCAAASVRVELSRIGKRSRGHLAKRTQELKAHQ
jgi:hypothetical protein